MRLRGAAVVRGLYYRAVAPYAALVLGLVVIRDPNTSVADNLR